MITRTDFSPSKSRRVSTLENSWNSTIQLPHQPRRHQQMTKDIKQFIFNSMEGSIHQTERQSAVRARKTDGMDIFGKISSTFNFTHHEGTDAKTELKVVKIILIREGQIMTLTHLSDKARSAGNVNSLCSSILEVLAEIRESTLNYLEALCLWRNSIVDGHTMSPRVFYWEDKNYTLKIVNDLDFLADNLLIIQALNISPEQFRSNPLMLTNNLDDPNTWMNPVDRAGQDAGGIMQGPVFESRLRLRYAERILLQEIELSSNPSVEDAGTFLTEPQSQQPQGFGQFASKYQPQPAVMKGSVVPPQSEKKSPMRGSAALESDFDDDSYSREDESGLNGLGGLADKSVWGLPDSFGDGNANNDNMKTESGDSESAVRPSRPGSRSSSINGLSAPNSSQSARNGYSPNLNSLRHVSNNNTGLLSAPSATAMGIAHKDKEAARFEFGHDFFSGHWAESQAFQGSTDSAKDGPADDEGIFFVDEGRDMSPGKATRKNKPPADDEVSLATSQHSLQSVDSVGSMEIHVVCNLRHPPKNLVLAAAACVILLTPGPEIPADVSWSAFLKMSAKVNISALLRALNPLKVHKFKVLAIKPILSQLMDEATYDGLMSNSVPFQEYAAINKLVSWLQHFTTQSIALQSQRKQHAILSPTQDPAKRRLKEKRDAAKVALLAPGEVDISQLYTSFDADLSNLPSKKRVIPSGSLQLAPFYSEVDNTLYKAPLLIALLAAFERKGTGRTKYKPRPPRSTKNAADFEEDEATFDRLVVKVYDVTGSAEFQHTVIIREYVILLAELEESYHNLAHKYFQPEDRDWWSENIIRVLNVQPKPNDKLKISISRKAIEQIVSEGVASGVTPPRRIKPKPEPVLQKPVASAVTTVPTGVKKRDPLTSKLTKNPSTEHSSTVRTPAVASTAKGGKVLPDAPKSAPESKKPFSQPKLEPVKAPPAATKALPSKIDTAHQKTTSGRNASPQVSKVAATTKPSSSSTSSRLTGTSSKTPNANPVASVSAKSLVKAPATKNTNSVTAPVNKTKTNATAVHDATSVRAEDDTTAARAGAPTVNTEVPEQGSTMCSEELTAASTVGVPEPVFAPDSGNAAEKGDEVEYDEDFASVDAAGDALAEAAIADSMDEANYAEDFDEAEQPPVMETETPAERSAETTEYEEEEFAPEEAEGPRNSADPEQAPTTAIAEEIVAAQEVEAAPVMVTAPMEQTQDEEKVSKEIKKLDREATASEKVVAVDVNGEYGDDDFEPEPELSTPQLAPPQAPSSCDEDVMAEQADVEPTQSEMPQQNSMSMSVKEPVKSLSRVSDDKTLPVFAPMQTAVSEKSSKNVQIGGSEGGEEYGEDFEDNSAYTGGMTGFDDANTTDAVNPHDAIALVEDSLDPAQQGISIKENENKYYSDFEENSLDAASAASGLVMDHQSNSQPEEASDPNRPLSAIEAAQREFDEVGEEDGVFFDSVDEEYI